jgi:hypothetical protein
LYVFSLTIPRHFLYMNTQITPVNITAAALITQFSIIIILYIGLIILRKDDEPKSIFLKKPDSSFFLILLGFALITIGCLVFSDEFSNVWKPLFREITFGGINWSTALIIVFPGYAESPNNRKKVIACDRM